MGENKRKPRGGVRQGETFEERTFLQQLIPQQGMMERGAQEKWGF